MGKNCFVLYFLGVFFFTLYFDIRPYLINGATSYTTRRAFFKIVLQK
jgi:hypothetical protein